MFSNIQRNGGVLWRSCIIHVQKNNKVVQNRLLGSHLSFLQLGNQVTRFHFSAQPQTLEKINNYENLVKRINTSESLQDTLQVFKDNEDIYKCEHLASTARQFARLQTKNKPDIDGYKDPLYLKFTEKVIHNLNKFNETELLDLLFWVRKFKASKTGLGFLESKYFDLFDRIFEQVKNNQYKLKQLTVIYSDISQMGRDCDEVCTKLLQELNKDPSQLTPFICLNLLSSISSKYGINSGKELILIDTLCKYVPNIYDQLEIQQKSLMFKSIAIIEPFIHPPKYKMPNIMYTLKNDLKENIDSLSEQSAFNILLSYKHLIYSHFPQDLLEELKEMIIVTIKHNPKNIKSSFLIDFLEQITQLNKNKKKKTEMAKMNILINELTKRIQENDDELLFGKVDKLVNYCEKYIKSKSSLITVLSKQYEKRINQYYNQHIIDIVAKKAPIEVFDSLLNAFLGDASIQDQITKVKSLYKCLYNHRDRYKELFEALQKQVEEIIESDPKSYIFSSKFHHGTNHLKKELLLKSINRYIQICQNDQNHFLAKTIIASLEYKEARQIWFNQFFNEKTINDQLIYKLIEQFFSQETFDNQEKFTFLVQILGLSKKHQIYPTKILINCIKDSTKFLEDITKHEYTFRKLLSSMLENFKKNPEQIRLINIYEICLRLESIGMNLDFYYKFMSQVFDIWTNQDSKKNNESHTYISFIYQIKLVENNVLKSQHAKNTFETSHIQDVLQKGKLLSLIANHDQSYFQENKQQYDTYFKLLLSNLNTTHSIQVLNNIASIIRMPPIYLQQEHNYIIKSLKENISSANSQCYVNLLTSIPQNHSEIHTPIIKELIAYFPQIQKFQYTEIRKILQKVCDLNINDHQLLSSILQEIGNNFYTMSIEDRMMSLKSFCRMKIRQDDFIEKSLHLVYDNIVNYRSYYLLIVESLYKVGYQSEALSEFLFKAIKIWKLSSQEYLFTLLLISISQHKQKEMIEEISLKLQNPGSYLDSKISKSYLQDSILCNLYYSKFHPENPEILKFLEKLHNSTNKIDSPIKFIASHNSYQNIQKYLTAMGVEYKTSHIIDNYVVPLYIPSSKQIIKVNSNANLNFDRKTLDSRSIIEQMILESIDDQKVITINMPEFYSFKSDQLSKISFLMKKGIECESASVFDFSKFQAQNADEVVSEDTNQQQDQDEDLEAPEEEDLLNVSESEYQNQQKKFE